MTQRELANGVVTQSLISQVETGRAMPSDSVLRVLAERFQVDVEALSARWEGWRDSQTIRLHLWQSGLRLQDERVRELLLQHGHRLVQFETYVYAALSDACTGQFEDADAHLYQAWSKEVAEESGLAFGFKLRGHPQPNARLELKLGWTTNDYGRALVIEAKARELLYQGIQRVEAAKYWGYKAKERMKGII